MVTPPLDNPPPLPKQINLGNPHLHSVTSIVDCHPQLWMPPVELDCDCDFIFCCLFLPSDMIPVEIPTLKATTNQIKSQVQTASVRTPLQ